MTMPCPSPPQQVDSSRVGRRVPTLLPLLIVLALHLGGPHATAAAELAVVLENARGVTQVGALDRWDAAGDPRVPVDPKARIDAPALTCSARLVGRDRWVFSDLPPGTYDLVILTKDRVRIEGFHYPAVLEFDESFQHQEGLDEAARQAITSDIAQSRHYENRVTPLYMSGDAKAVRVLMQLLRDEPTSYDAEYGEPVATLRHEVWQYTCNYGAWTKEKRTRVLDRILVAKRVLRQWTWVWLPQLGGIKVSEQDTVVRYRLPDTWNPTSAVGLLPPES